MSIRDREKKLIPHVPRSDRPVFIFTPWFGGGTKNLLSCVPLVSLTPLLAILLSFPHPQWPDPVAVGSGHQSTERIRIATSATLAAVVAATLRPHPDGFRELPASRQPQRKYLDVRQRAWETWVAGITDHNTHKKHRLGSFHIIELATREYHWWQIQFHSDDATSTSRGAAAQRPAASEGGDCGGGSRGPRGEGADHGGGYRRGVHGRPLSPVPQAGGGGAQDLRGARGRRGRSSTSRAMRRTAAPTTTLTLNNSKGSSPTTATTTQG